MIPTFLNFLKYEKNYSENTLISYNNDLVDYSDYLILIEKDIANDDITSDDVRMWLLQLMEQGNKATTINRKISTLKTFYKFHIANNNFTHNPTAKVVAPKKTKPLPVFFSEKDLEKLLQVKNINRIFDDTRDLLIIETFYQTGIRCSELLNIKDEHIDFSAKSLKVLGKGNKERIVPFGNDLKLKIQDYTTIRDKEIQRQCNNLFVTTKGTPLSKSKIYTIVRENMSLVSTKYKKSPHVLRHTFATTMLNNGADINAIKNILGHESLSATQVYTHTTFDKLHDIYEQAHPRALKKRRNYEP